MEKVVLISHDRKHVLFELESEQDRDFLTIAERLPVQIQQAALGMPEAIQQPSGIRKRIFQNSGLKDFSHRYLYFEKS